MLTESAPCGMSNAAALFEQASSMSSRRSPKTEAHQQKKKGCLCSCEGKGFEVLGEEHAQSRSGETPA